MPKSVLIVDDEPRITAALMTRLEAYGYTVYHAINGLAGVEAAALYEPDAIILDIRLPDIDGYETCERIRRFPRLESTPVVFLSANVQDEAIDRAKQAGGSRFISKPYDAVDIQNAIEELSTSRPAA
ncbi:MAG: response regulator [bacterium]|nr:response regulator [bacterium]